MYLDFEGTVSHGCLSYSMVLFTQPRFLRRADNRMRARGPEDSKEAAEAKVFRSLGVTLSPVPRIHIAFSLIRVLHGLGAISHGLIRKRP